jgi:hypothetical protein
MTDIRSAAHATLLPNEAVLVAGGTTAATTEIYNPSNIVKLSKSTLNFGGQLLLHSGASQELLLYNLATTTMSIAKIATTGDFSHTTNCSATLLPDKACAIYVTFEPTVAGTRTGALNLTFADAPFAADVVLDGTGLTHQLVASLTSVSLRTVDNTSTSTAATVTNQAPGTAPVSLTLAGAGFTKTTTCGATLDTGKSCQVTITFSPKAVTTYSGTLTVASTVGSQPISLAGTGTPIALSLTPSSIAFGAVAVNDDVSQSITVKNPTAIPFNITGVSITGAGFVVNGNNCRATLAVGASCTVVVQFAPTSVTNYSGAATVSDNQGGKHIVTLSGTGG